MAKINSVTLLYFSPTGTTKRILEAISKGLGADAVEHMDMTSHGGKIADNKKPLGDLTVIGVPVYTGRVALPAERGLQRLKAKDTPAVIVAVYGNREYEDALIELRDISIKAGFTPIAGAAFVGEHSFSTKDTPIAEGRPDTDDLSRAAMFGKMVREKLAGRKSISSEARLEVPGNIPYRERGPARNTSPETDEEKCLYCGKCVEVCPMTAIRLHDSKLTTDTEKCILCCACVKACPCDARVLTHPQLKQFAQSLSGACSTRKEPEFFL